MEEEIKRVVTLLRKRAEDILKSRPESGETQYSESEILKLLHELEVYSVELELQNEELQKGLAAPEEKRYKLSEAQVLQLIHELEVHQLELEMQNNELEYSKSVSQDVAERYSDLFGFSPTGYLILSPKGEVIDLNWSAARIMGKDRLTLKNSLFASFVSEIHQPVFAAFLKSIFIEKTKKSCDISFPTYDAGIVFANISGIITTSEQQCLLTLADTTDRVQSGKFRKIKQEILSILHGKSDTQGMISSSLDVLKTSSGFDAVALRVQSGNEFPIVAHAGYGQEVIITGNSISGPDEAGKVYIHESGSPAFECGCGMTIGIMPGQPGVCESAGGSWWVNNMVALPGAAAGAVPHPQQNCMHRTYNSMAMIPLCDERGQSSFLQLSCIHKHYFTPVIIDILEEIAGHLGDALACRKKEEALHAAEKLLQSVTNNSPHIIMQVGKDGTIMYINHELHGSDSDVVAGMHFSEWVLPVHQAAMNQALWRVFGEGVTEVLEVREKYKKGKFHWHKVTITPVKSGDEIIYAMLASQDITHAKSIEEKHRENEQRMSAILDTAMDGYVVFDRNGRIFDVNKTYCRLSGYTRRELLSMHLADIEYAMSAEQISAAIEEVMQIGEVRFESKHRRKDGSPIDVEISATYSSLQKERFISFVHDISKRKQREELMAKSNELYKLLFENSGDAILIREAGGGVVSANTVACKMLGRTEEDTKGLPRDKVFDLNDPRVARAFEERDRTGNFKGELTFLRKDGTTLPVEVTTTKFSDAEGKEMVCIFARDISERKQAEEKLREQQELMNKAEEISHLSSWSLDLVTNTLVWSSEAYRICGVPVGYKDMTYEFFLSVVHPDDREAVDNAYSGSIREGRDTYEIEHRLIRQDTGEIRNIHEKCEHYRDASGKIVRSVGMMYDITEQKQAQEKLRQSEERYKSIFEDSRSVMLLIDPGTSRIMDANPAACDYYGWPHDVMCSMNINQVNLLSMQEVEAEMKLAVKEHRNQFFFRHRLASGEVRDVEVYSAPVNIGDAKMLFSIVHDITERRNAEEALKKNKDNLRAILDATKESIFVFDIKGVLIDANETAASRLNKSLKSILRKHISEVFPADISARRWQQFIKVFKSGMPISFTDTRADYIFENNLFPVFENGKVSSVVSFSRDITERRRSEEALRASEERFRSVLDNSKDAIYRFNLQSGQYEYLSPAFETIYGYTLDDMNAFQFQDVFKLNHPEDMALVEAGLKTLENIGYATIEYRFITKKGEYRWSSISMSLIRDTKGMPLFRDGIIRDITERKKAEETLQKNEKLFKSVIDNVSSGVALIDETGHFVVCNPVFLELFGLSEDSTIKNINDQNWGEWQVFDEDRKLLHVDNHPVRKAAMTGKGVKNQLVGMILPTGGEFIWMLVNAEPVLKPTGEIEQIICTYHNITQRKQDEDALRRSEERFQLALNNSPVAVAIQNSNFIYQWSYNIASLPSEKLVGKTDAELFSPEEAELMMDYKRRVIEYGTSENYQAWIQLGNGQYFFNIYYKPLRNADGEITGIGMSAVDLTEQKLAEQALHQYIKAQELLADASTRLLGMVSIPEVMQFAVEQIYQMAGSSIVVLSEYSHDHSMVNIKAVAGDQDKLEKLKAMLGQPLQQISFSSAPYVQEQMSGRGLLQLDLGLHELSQGQIPEELSSQIESELGFASSYVMPLLVENDLIGSLFITTDYPQELQNKHLIETFIKQVSLSLRNKRVEQALLESRLELETALSSMSDAILITDKEGTFINFNDAFAHMLRFRDKAETARRFNDYPDLLDLHFPDGTEVPLDKWPVRRALNGETATNQEYHIRRKDTGESWVDSYSFSPICSYDGDIMGCVLVGRDITEKKLAEETLKANKRILDAVFNGVTEAIMMLDMEGNILAANNTAAQRWHRSVDDVLGRHISEFITKESQKKIPAQLKDMVETAMPVHFEDQRGDREYDLTFYPIIESSGEIRQYVVFNRDITEQKRAERALYESEKKLSNLIFDMQVGIVLNDVKPGVLMSNPKALELLGISSDQLLGKAAFDPEWKAIHEDGSPFPSGSQPVIWSVPSGDPIKNVVMGVYRPATRDWVWLMVDAVPHTDEAGNIYQVVYSFMDITSLKTAQNELRASEERFRSLVYDMQVGLVLNSNRGDIILSNPKASELLGLTESQMQGKSPADPEWMPIHEDGSPFPGEDHPISHVLRTGKPVRDVVMGIYQPQKKEYVWLLVNSQPQLGEDGSVQQVVTSFVDITQQKNIERIVRESEQRLQYHFENSPLAIVEWDENNIVKEWSIEAEKIFGWQKEDAIGKRLDSIAIVYEQDVQTVNSVLERLSAGKENIIVSSNRNITRWGKVIDCIWYNSVLLNEQGKMSSVMSLVQDVTRQKQAEQALIKSEEKFSLIYEKSPYAISLIRMSDGRIEDVNEAFVAIFGHAYEDVIGKKADKLGLFTDHKDDVIHEIKRKGFVHDVEYANCKKSGEDCIFRYNIDIVESSGQKYYIHRAEDITARKQSEQELREREYFFRESQQAAFIGSYKADFNSGFWESSEVLDRIFGIDKNYVRSIQGWLDMVHPSDRDKMKHFLLREIYKKGAVFNNEFRIVRKNDGETRWVHGVGRIDFDENNKIKSLLGTIQDITERKQREEKLRKLNQTLAALSKSSVAITQVSDEEEYLKQICKIVVEDTDFSMAWIGFIDEQDASKTVKPVASAGFKDDYLQSIKLIWEDSEQGQGPTGTAIRTGKPSMCNDMENDPSFAPWREQALKRGFASSIAFPLKTGDTVFGVISIYSKESNVFNDDVEISLLTELANDLAHGINTIRLRASHRLAEEALSRSHSELEVLVKERTRELQITNELLKKEIVVRKQQEKTLHQAEEKYRTVANFAANWEFWIDPKGIMIYCSPSCERITGYKASEFVENNQLIYNIIHPDDLEMYWKHVKTELDAVLHEHEFQFRIIRKDGLVRWLGHYCQPIFDDAGNFKGTRGSNKDITARRKMESMLVTSNQKYRLLSENISDGIFICKNGKFEYVNKAVCTILGYKRKELERMKLTQVVMSDYNEQLETILYSKEPVNHSRNLEVECLKKDLSVIFVEILLNYVAEEKTVYGVIQDITERKQLHKSIVKAIIETEENEKAHFSKELHDGLGPLLSTIKLYLQWSARAKTNESREEIIHKAEEILEESLTTVREVSNKLSPHLLTNYGLNSAIKSFVDKLQATSAINIQYEGEFNRRLEVEVEAALYRATIECINNSIKHANAKNIRITLKDVAGRIYLTYTDDGEGFDVSKTLTTKKGLGLFNMQNRIQNIGGKVSIWSEPGRGVNYEFIVNA